jgi:hypothetical protein
MKTYWGVEIRLHAFLTSVLDGGEWRTLRSAALPQGKGPWYPLYKTMGEPQNRSGRGGEEKNS